MNGILKSTGLVFLLAWLSHPASVHAQWNVRNNLGERFTIYVWPSNDPSDLQTRKLENGAQQRIQLGADPHEIELLSRGGDLYVLEPTKLRTRQGVTNLKTILTPKDRKVRGRTVYNYMNQQGFDEGDAERVEQLPWSAWRTTYNTPGGGSVTTDLKFAGNSGTYDGGRGKLSEISYEEQGNLTVIRGKWVFNSQVDGRFTFYVNNNNPNQFTSTPDGNNSTWSGKRLSVAP